MEQEHIEAIDALVRLHDGDRHAAHRFYLKVRLRTRREEVTEPAIAAEALRIDPRALVADNKLYPSISAAAKEFGLPPNVINWRVNGGDSLQGAVDKTRQSSVVTNHINGIDVNGTRYGTLKAAANAYGIPPDTITVYRKKNGGSIEEAINELKKLPRFGGYLIRGKRFSTTREIASKLKINRTGIRKFTKKGLSVEEGVEAILLDRASKTITINGTDFPNLNAAAKAYGVEYSSILARKKNGETNEQAINDLARPNGARARSVIVHEVTYPTLTDAAVAYGLSRDMVYDAMRRPKRTPQQAIDHLLAKKKAKAA